MKTLMMILLIPAILMGQEVATFTPEKPVFGGKVTITYNPASKAAVLRTAKSITAEVLAVTTAWQPKMTEVTLKKSGPVFTGTFDVDRDHRLYAVQFSEGETTDNNGDLGWSILAYDADGQPAENALAMRGQWYNSGRAMTLKFEKSPEKARADYETELRLRPASTTAHFSLWRMEMQQSPGEATVAKIKGQLERLYEQKKDDEKAVAGMLMWFDQTGQKDRSATLKQEWTTRSPKGPLVRNIRSSEMFAERDPVKRFELMEKLEAEFTAEPEERDNRDMMYVNFAAAAKQNEKALARMKTMTRPDPMTYNNLAWQSIEKGENLEPSVAAAKLGIDILRKNDPALKPGFMTSKQWDKSKKYQLGMILDTYGYGLAQLGRDDDALTTYEEAYTNLDGGDADVNLRYVSALVKDKQFKKAMEVSASVVKKGKSDDKLLEQYKSAFVALKGSDKGFEDELARARSVAKKEARDKVLKSMISKPAGDFTLKGLDGSTVTLSKLRGKVVVIDFWATWCGPCKASFPYLQKVYDKYKSNPNVVILAVNTWENEKGEAREKTVRKFIEDNKYTFPVVFDDNVVAKYGVEGIPTKFIVDRKGRIRFKDVGFGGGPEMMDKMDQQFELLLSEDVSMK